MPKRGQKIAQHPSERIRVSSAVIFAWAAMIVFTFTAITLTVAATQHAPAGVQAKGLYVQDR